jgi:hypothetical protein
MTKTEFHPIPNLRHYQITASGDVYSFYWRKPRKLNPSKRHNSGYLQVRLYVSPGKRPKWFYIHRLVLEALIGPCPDGMEACHNDGDPRNNNISNLRWDTHANNGYDAYRHGRHPDRRGSKHPQSKLKELDIPVIRRLHENGYGYCRIARIYGVSHTTIRYAIIGKQWKHCVPKGLVYVPDHR